MTLARVLAGGLVAASAVAGLAGCGDPNTGTAGAAEVRADFQQRFGSDLVRLDVDGQNTLPYAGSVTAFLVLRDDVSAARFAEIEQYVRDFHPKTAGAGYAPRGVRANGIAVCSRDSTRDAMVQLREALRAAGRMLSGTFWCSDLPPHGAAYQGTLAQLTGDLTLLRPLLSGAATDARASLELSDLPTDGGSVALASIPATLEATVVALRRYTPIESANVLSQRSLLFTVPRALAPEQLAEALQAASKAAGPGMGVQIRPAPDSTLRSSTRPPSAGAGASPSSPVGPAGSGTHAS